MKIAILLVGYLRTWEETKSNFIQSFSNKFDIFVSTYDKRYGYHPYIWRLTPDKSEEYYDKETILALFKETNTKVIEVENSDKINEQNLKMYEKFHPIFEKRADYYGQYRKFKNAINLMKQYELDNNFKYDIVIKTRPDLLYNNLMVQNFNFKNSVLTDQGNVQPNDCFIMSSRDNIVNIIEFIEQEFFNPKFFNSNEKPPHGMLENSFKYLNITNVPENIIKVVARKGFHQNYS